MAGSRRSGRQPRAKTAHFSVSGAGRRVDVPESDEISSDGSSIRAGRLLMAVPKRLLKRAVDRNAVRRAARLAWRTRVLAHRQVAGDTLLRMTACPSGLAQISRPKRKKIWRQELEELMDTYLGNLDA